MANYNSNMTYQTDLTFDWPDEQTDHNIGDINRLLAEMQGSRYKFNNLNGIAKSTRFDEHKIVVILDALKSKNIIEEVVMNTRSYFKLTELGQRLNLLTNTQ
jgi:hypothetical protein